MVAIAVHYVPQTVMLNTEIQNATTNAIINESNNRSESTSERYILKVSQRGQSLVMLKKHQNFGKEYGEPLLSIRFDD